MYIFFSQSEFSTFSFLKYFFLLTWEYSLNLLVRICEEFYPGKGAAMRIQVSPNLNNKKIIIKRAHYTVLDRNSLGAIILFIRGFPSRLPVL
jgi:hypothetical protein